MKVTRTGDFIFTSDFLVVRGWTFKSDEYAAGMDSVPQHVVLRTCLLYIAQKYGVQLVAPAAIEPVERLTIESERVMLDAIAIARWKEQP